MGVLLRDGVGGVTWPGTFLEDAIKKRENKTNDKILICLIVFFILLFLFLYVLVY